MIAIAVRYLMERAVASSHADYSEPEWPPHPDRLFQALVAARSALESPEDDARGELEALRWLESQAPPLLYASDAAPRGVVTVYVPVNDLSAPRVRQGAAISRSTLESGLALLPEHRLRQPRHFPASVPQVDTVVFRWDADPPAAVVGALARLLRAVTYLGHSSSPVEAWIDEDPRDPNLLPTEGVARYRLRIPTRGRLESLEARYEAQLRPSPAPAVGYRPVEPTRAPAPGTVFSPFPIVLRLSGPPHPTLTSTLALTTALRGALLASGGAGEIPEWISGHQADGSASTKPHLALTPLANTSHEHADGRVLGLALWIPQEMEIGPDGGGLSRLLLDPTTGDPRRLRLTLGRAGVCELDLDEREVRPVSLREATWTRTARLWGSVTPVALDRHPKQKNSEAEIEKTIADSVERIGLPRPALVVARTVSPHLGVPPSWSFPRIERKSRGCLRHTHAVIAFEDDVRGPILLGAGRYRGYGFFRPIVRSGVE